MTMTANGLRKAITLSLTKERTVLVDELCTEGVDQRASDYIRGQIQFINSLIEDINSDHFED